MHIRDKISDDSKDFKSFAVFCFFFLEIKTKHLVNKFNSPSISVYFRIPTMRTTSPQNHSHFSSDPHLAMSRFLDE